MIAVRRWRGKVKRTVKRKVIYPPPRDKVNKLTKRESANDN